MFSGQIAFYADNCVADERLVTEYEKLAALVSFVVGGDCLSNLQIITCLILRNLFGLYLFSHQSCATGTLLLRK